MPYDDERLGQLLALLPPAPAGWVATAKRIPLMELDARELAQKLEADPAFRKSFDADPVAAAEAAGLPELAAQLERELEQLVALAERIAAGAEPQAVLAETAFPEEAVEPFLRALGVPDAELPEVVLHGHARVRPRARLLTLLLETAAAAQTLRRR